MVSDLAARGGVRLKPVLDRDLHLRVDELKLTQCVLNTLSNAVKFTPAGGEVDVSVAIEPDWVVLRIRDTGLGHRAGRHPESVRAVRSGGATRSAARVPAWAYRCRRC